jgi:hypothetical protein
MIRHANCGWEFRGRGLAAAIISLPIAMVEASFRTLLMPAASRAQLLDAGLKATGEAAIALPSVAVGADQEESATIRGLAESLTERLFRRRCEQHHRAQGQSLDNRRRGWQHRGNLRMVASETGRQRKTPVVDINRGLLFRYCPHPIKNWEVRKAPAAMMLT